MSESTLPHSDETLDASGLTCPMPVLRAQRKLREMPAGQVLELLSTDPIALKEVPLFCQQAGHHLLAVPAGKDSPLPYRFLIRKA